MSRQSLLLSLGVAVALCGQTASLRAADLEITVHNVANNRGRVLVAICTEATFLGDQCPYTGAEPAVAGTTTVIVRDISPGTYAIQAFHDENENLDLDRTLLGFPKEGVGFSNDAPIRFGPPRFRDAAVPVTAPTQRTAFSLRYF